MTSISEVGPGLNAFTFAFDEKVLNELRITYQTHIRPFLLTPELSPLFEGRKQREGRFGAEGYNYAYTSYGEEPLFWVANNNERTYQDFERFYRSLLIEDAVKGIVDYDKSITLYCGFLVVGNHADHEFWHLDYAPGANAYTLITPLFAPDPAHGDLLYQDSAGTIHTYEYRLGEAILLGDNFPHTTEPYQQTGSTRVLVSLTMGTDKVEYWPILEQSVGAQSEFVVLPCGHPRGACDCLEKLRNA